MCGGTIQKHVIPIFKDGLSPRVRGNRHVGRIGALYPRVYPRVCGGTGDIDINSGSFTGSIPACAGEPEIADALGDDPKVYPRVCGGTSRTTSPASVNSGLSPRVRGEPTSAAGGDG